MAGTRARSSRGSFLFVPQGQERSTWHRPELMSGPPARLSIQEVEGMSTG